MGRPKLTQTAHGLDVMCKSLSYNKRIKLSGPQRSRFKTGPACQNSYETEEGHVPWELCVQMLGRCNCGCLGWAASGRALKERGLRGALCEGTVTGFGENGERKGGTLLLGTNCLSV